jgi:hypothetical protein
MFLMCLVFTLKFNNAEGEVELISFIYLSILHYFWCSWVYLKAINYSIQENP